MKEKKIEKKKACSFNYKMNIDEYWGPMRICE
jgi:hypothetical protein